jgi:syntaxin-binding protein 5
MEHEEEAEIQQLLFLVNEGALISVTDGSCLHMWTLRQKVPSVVQKLRFTREKVTCCCLPLQSQWLYVGTEAGNVRFVDVHQFTLSVYGVLWNQAISVQQKEKPGAVVIISEQPTDTNKLLIGYQQGQLVLWDLKLRQAVFRLKHASPFSCASWLSDGSKFVCGHLNGLLTVWSSKNPPSLLETLASSHHGKEDEILSPVTHVEWLSRSGRDPMLLYAGGMPRSHSLNQGCLTALHGKSTEVSMFSAPILGLNCLCQQPYRDGTHEGKQVDLVSVIVC